MVEKNIEQKNAEFWNELCGSGLAQSLGINEINPENLHRFDQAYLGIYPYLKQYVSEEELKGKKILEIGLGYGTLGELLASCGCDYFGLDIAPNAVEMMRYRLAQLGENDKEKVKVASALDIPYEDGSFDYVYSIGCLHHTGNLSKSISEVHRVLAPNGRAIIMLYNKNSFRQIIDVPFKRLGALWSRKQVDSNSYKSFAEFVRSLYDTNSKAEAAPHTDYVSTKEVRHIFRNFSHVKIDIRNFDAYVLFNGKIVIHREKLINNIGRILGLDLYIIAVK